MAVRCPSYHWPPALEELGPVEDPSILLAGTARIGPSSMRIIAIRTTPASRRIPDYKDGISRECYQTNGHDIAIETILDNFEGLAADFDELLGQGGSETVELVTGSYIVVALSVQAPILTESESRGLERWQD